MCSIARLTIPPPLFPALTHIQVLARIFPVRRGLFEDYVANWWCASSLAVKWKTAFPPHAMLRAAAGATLAAAAPAMLHQVGCTAGAGLYEYEQVRGGRMLVGWGLDPCAGGLGGTIRARADARMLGGWRSGTRGCGTRRGCTGE